MSKEALDNLTARIQEELNLIQSLEEEIVKLKKAKKAPAPQEKTVQEFTAYHTALVLKRRQLETEKINLLK